MQALLHDPDCKNESGPMLLPYQRHQFILEFLVRHEAATLRQLSQSLRVSLSTLRRDLDALAEEGAVERTHGGVILRHLEYGTFEPDASVAAGLSRSEKRAIGRFAAESLQSGQSVIFDSGSTTLEAARAVATRNLPLIGITNDLLIAQILGTAPNIQVYVFGGALRPGSHTLIGDAVISSIRSLRADVLLMGGHAVTGTILSETSLEIASVKRAFIESATKRLLLVDSSKFRPRALRSVCKLQEINEVISDNRLSRDTQDQLRAMGIRLSLVGASQ